MPPFSRPCGFVNRRNTLVSVRASMAPNFLEAVPRSHRFSLRRNAFGFRPTRACCPNFGEYYSVTRPDFGLHRSDDLLGDPTNRQDPITTEQFNQFAFSKPIGGYGIARQERECRFTLSFLWIETQCATLNVSRPLQKSLNMALPSNSQTHPGIRV